MAFLGILAAGGVFAGTNPSHTPYELAHSWKIAQARGLLVEPELLPNALKAAKQCNIPASRIFVFDHQTPVTTPYEGPQKKWHGLRSWRYLFGHGERDWETWDDEKRSRETTAARLFSSGTTGMPKAVDLSHHNFVAQHTLVMEYKPRDYEVCTVNRALRVETKRRECTRSGRSGWNCFNWVLGCKITVYAYVPRFQRAARTHFSAKRRTGHIRYASLRT
jgi:long-subunit acyl-CoA synthetase (AMP-forming)